MLVKINQKEIKAQFEGWELTLRSKVWCTLYNPKQDEETAVYI